MEKNAPLPISGKGRRRVSLEASSSPSSDSSPKTPTPTSGGRTKSSSLSSTNSTVETAVRRRGTSGNLKIGTNPTNLPAPSPSSSPKTPTPTSGGRTKSSSLSSTNSTGHTAVRRRGTSGNLKVGTNPTNLPVPPQSTNNGKNSTKSQSGGEASDSPMQKSFSNMTLNSLHAFGEDDEWINKAPITESSPKVLIIYTGGTMGMNIQDDGGLAPERGYLTKRIKEMEEMANKNMPHCRIKEYDVLIDSSDMTYDDMGRMAADINNEYFNYDGFVVITGTDTMAYAATALSFMLENLAKTVVFTGSQIPFSEIYNDARRNLIASVIFAGNREFSEVCVCFNDRLLRGCRTVKINSFGLDAFHSPNLDPLATLGVNISLRKDIAMPPPQAPFRVFNKLSREIVVVQLLPSFYIESLDCIVEHTNGLKGIIVQFFGAGNGPSSTSAGLVTVLAKARDKGILVIATSQCLKGSVVLNMYSASSAFAKLGVISAGDMTKEACAVKLSYLFAKHGNDLTKISTLFQQNLRGEKSDDLTYTKSWKFN